jgi:hypothetical protein
MSETPPYIALEILLTETIGWFGKTGRPQMYCWFKAFHLPGHGFDDASISILATDGPQQEWREFSRRLSFTESSQIAAQIAALGILERPLDVEGVVDTANVWADLFLRVKSPDKAGSLELHTQASGFAGPDAETLRALLRQLFDYAGYSDYERPVYG